MHLIDSRVFLGSNILSLESHHISFLSKNRNTKLFLSRRRTISYFQDDWSFITHFSLASSFILSHFLSCFLFIRFSFREQIPWSGGRITWPTETFFGKQFKWKTKRFSKTLLVYRWYIYTYIYHIYIQWLELQRFWIIKEDEADSNEKKTHDWQFVSSECLLLWSGSLVIWLSLNEWKSLEERL